MNGQYVGKCATDVLETCVHCKCHQGEWFRSILIPTTPFLFEYIRPCMLPQPLFLPHSTSKYSSFSIVRPSWVAVSWKFFGTLYGTQISLHSPILLAFNQEWMITPVHILLWWPFGVGPTFMKVGPMFWKKFLLLDLELCRFFSHFDSPFHYFLLLELRARRLAGLGL
jgi:hypothetical protein